MARVCVCGESFFFFNDNAFLLCVLGLASPGQNESQNCVTFVLKLLMSSRRN